MSESTEGEKVMTRLLVLLLACASAGSLYAQPSGSAQPSRAEQMAFCVALAARAQEIAELRQAGRSRLEVLSLYLMRSAGAGDIEGMQAYKELIEMVTDSAIQEDVAFTDEARKRVVSAFARTSLTECQEVVDEGG